MRVEPAEVDRRVEKIKAASRDAGVKLTHQRLEIFREIAASLDHPDADTVFRAVRRRMPTVSLDTVYRTLWMLNDLGLIGTLGPRRETVRFDANLAQHHHFVCTRCGLARDFESPSLDALSIPAVVRKFGSVSGAHVEVRGVCERCTKRPRESSHAPAPVATKGRRPTRARGEGADTRLRRSESNNERRPT